MKYWRNWRCRRRLTFGHLFSAADGHVARYCVRSLVFEGAWAVDDGKRGLSLPGGCKLRLDAPRCSHRSKQRVQVVFPFVGDRSLVVHVNRVYSNCFVSKIARVYFCELHYRPGQTTFYTARTCLAQRATLKNWEWPGYEASTCSFQW